MTLIDEFSGDGKINLEKIMSSKIDSSLEKRLNDITKVYESWIDDPFTETFNYFLSYAQICYLNAIDLLKPLEINPKDIEEFCFDLGRYSEKCFFAVSGTFVSALLQSSYNQGHNDFKVYIKHSSEKVRHLGSYIKGEEENPMKIVLNSAVGKDAFEKSEHCDLVFNGDVMNHCANNIKHSNITFNGIAKDFCCDRAKFSRFVFNNYAGAHCGQYAFESEFIFEDYMVNCGIGAQKSKFLINDVAGELCGLRAVECEFYSDDLKVLKKIKANSKKKNKIFRVYGDGKIKKYNFWNKLKDKLSKRNEK